MRSYWAPEAEGRLLAIIARLNAFSAGSGDGFAQRLRQRIGELESMPFLGRRVPEFENSLVRELVFRGYRVFYEVFPDRIEVFSILHGRQNVPGETD